MRISDWSSDVCSSDLVAGAIQEFDHIASRNARQQPPAPARQNDLLDASAVFVRGSGAHFCNVAAQEIDRDAFDSFGDLIGDGPLLRRWVLPRLHFFQGLSGRLPCIRKLRGGIRANLLAPPNRLACCWIRDAIGDRSEEHTSELQSLM